jgi:CHAD domain-containing protein
MIALPAAVPMPGTDLPPGVLADVGARQIHQALLRILVANEPGLRGNLDTEFLHDFRVAVRRTRSLLGQIKRVFPPEAVEHFSREFSWLGRLTGPARDIDVLVLLLRAQRAEIHPEDMEALTTFLGQAQQREHKRVVEALSGRRYQRLLTDWSAFLKRPAPSYPDAGNAGRHLADVVAQRAWRLSRRIARSIETINEHTPAAHFHEVRLAAKKLRYLVDVTSAFYDAADLERILSALKKMQRVLGDFNDAQAQEQRLLECARALAAADGPPRTVLALFHLANRCRARRDTLRRQVTDGLAKFRSRNTRSACRRAFKRTEPAEPTK